LNNSGTVSEEINKRTMTSNKAYYANSQLPKSAFLSRSTKLKLYRTLVRPVLTHATETWTLNISDENSRRIFERKIIRKVYGPVWRVRSNSEIYNFLQGEDIVGHAKSLRLSWLGHVERVENGRIPKCL
jgi:hypothetical protein